MYKIIKSSQPVSLTTYKYDPNASFDNLPTDVKTDIKESLLNEQGHVCAYCMGSIKTDNMKIEHWASQTHNPHLDLDYSNMLACCQGNEGQGSGSHTCDTKKQNLNLKYNPGNPNHFILSRITYNGQGHIQSPESDFDLQLQEVINLNESRLVKNRISAKQVVEKHLNAKPGTRKKSTIQNLIAKLKNKANGGSFTPYYGYLIYGLEKKIS